jgi:signal transduction histidine kinase
MAGRGLTVAGRWVLDAALAAVATSVAVVLTLELSSGLPAPVAVVAKVLAGVHGAVLVFRRVAPAAVLITQVGTGLGYAALGFPIVMLGPAVLVTLYTVGSRLARRRGLALLAGTEVALVAGLTLRAPFQGIESVGLMLQFGAFLAGAWFLGDIVRRWQVAAAEHARRADELERAREELARLAVTAERVRIARELHDVVAHSMSVIAMHAGTGRLAADRDPGAARRALEVAERVSREALAELRRLVTVLRDVDDPVPALAPAPGLPDVHRLVAEVAAAGVTVDVYTDGDLRAVPGGVSLAGYRIVQEALTNVVRHASPARVQLTVRVGDGAVTLEVVDDGARVAGPVPGAAGAGSGHGTIGMRERAAVYGGDLESGPRPGGGWRVAARLPCGTAQQ